MSNVPSNIEVKPAYLANLPEDDKSDLRKVMSPPRLKIIQATSGVKFKPQYRDGDIIIIPNMIHVGGIEQEFTFVPVHFFPTWCCTNPWKLKDQLPFIREMSFDEDSTVAKKAKAFIKEPCPQNNQYMIEYRQVLNFLIRIQSDVFDLPQNPVTLILNKGEYNTGRILSELIEKRPGPRYVCQFNARSIFRQGKEGNWYGLEFRNAPQMWVAEDKVEALRAEHIFLKDLVAKRQISIDMDDTDMNGEDASKETRF